ncbi:hypothetical protein AX17_005679 [Amanita inopinata Kibby_2008]|nr:hypothetical protein AX17_005679 [Amanita inopinata Kibby_2008]
MPDCKGSERIRLTCLMEFSGRDILLCLFSLVWLYYLWHQRRGRARLPLPPGPPKLPLLGHLLQIPTGGPVWETWAQWGNKYGSDIIHIEVPGASVVVVNSLHVAKELFEKRSSIYSSRPRFPMAGELVGWGWQFTIMEYCQRWRDQRRMFTQYFHPSKIGDFQPLLRRHANMLLQRTLDAPENLVNHYRHIMASMAISLAYGIKISPSGDPHIQLAEKALDGFGKAATPGTFLVDMLPILKHVPSFMPGAGFKRKAAEWRLWMEEFVHAPFVAAQKEIEEGVAEPSLTSHYLENTDGSGMSAEYVRNVKEIAATVFTAGSHTTASVLLSFTLAMVLYPEVQKKIQGELDRIVDQGRLPDFGDEESLPYLVATIKETLRWIPTTPVALPHSVTEDDVYEGYHIPKGSTVIGNVWAMLHNTAHYEEPTSFRPERFLKDGKLDPRAVDPVDIAFGFGRRACPGVHIALAMTFICSASLLSAFDICKAVDSEGNTVEPSTKSVHNIVGQPEPFKCSFVPRSKEVMGLVQNLGF